MKLAFIRTVVLLVSIGYSIIYPTLALRPKLGVIISTVSYGTVIGLIEYLNVLRSIGVWTPTTLRLSLSVISGVLNAFYIVWIGYNLFINGRQLRKLAENSTKDKNKYIMYKQMGIGLAIFAFVSISIHIVETVLATYHYQDDMWDSWWFFGAYWEFVYLALTIFIACLWRPNNDNLRYDYTSYDDSSPNPFTYSHIHPPLKVAHSAPRVYRHKEEPESPVQLALSTAALPTPSGGRTGSGMKTKVMGKDVAMDELEL